MLSMLIKEGWKIKQQCHVTWDFDFKKGWLIYVCQRYGIIFASLNISESGSILFFSRPKSLCILIWAFKRPRINNLTLGMYVCMYYLSRSLLKWLPERDALNF